MSEFMIFRLANGGAKRGCLQNARKMSLFLLFAQAHVCVQGRWCLLSSIQVYSRDFWSPVGGILSSSGIPGMFHCNYSPWGEATSMLWICKQNRRQDIRDPDKFCVQKSNINMNYNSPWVRRTRSFGSWTLIKSKHAMYALKLKSDRDLDRFF